MIPAYPVPSCIDVASEDWTKVKIFLRVEGEIGGRARGILYLLICLLSFKKNYKSLIRFAF